MKQALSWAAEMTAAQLPGRPSSNPATGKNAYREFLLEMGDFSLAYRNDNSAVNPPGKQEAGLHDLVELAPACPGGAPRPCPEAISAEEPGTMTVNYRNEPVALRVT